jgi:hypothetical protein
MSDTADRTAVGKIGRMPADIRREVCRRLADNETAQSIIEWIETEPIARAVLDEQFDGAKVLPQNLSEWKRNPEFSRFVKRREDVANAKVYSDFALDLAGASGSVSAGAVAIIGGKILELLENSDPDTAKALIKDVTRLRAREQEDAKQALRKRVVEQNDRKIGLAEKQFQIRACELFVDWSEDKRAKEIVEGKDTRSVKVDQLRLALFGDKPDNLDFGQ